MDEFVARLDWEALEVATGIREEGELLCRLDDIVVVHRDITRGWTVLMEKMSALGPDVVKDLDEMERIRKETESIAGAEEVVATWLLS